MIVQERDKLLSSQEVADLLQLSVPTVNAKAGRGEIPGFKVSKRWRFRQSAVEAYIEKQIAEQQRDKNV